MSINLIKLRNNVRTFVQKHLIKLREEQTGKIFSHGTKKLNRSRIYMLLRHQ